MTSKDPSYPERLFSLLFLAPFPPKKDHFMDSGIINQYVAGVWLGPVRTDVPLLQDLPESSCWERPPPTFGVSHHRGKLGPA